MDTLEPELNLDIKRREKEMPSETLISTATVKENLAMPLVFKSVEKSFRDGYLREILAKHGVPELAEKQIRQLNDEEQSSILKLKGEVSKEFPDLATFLQSLETDPRSSSCLAFMQGEMFSGIASLLKDAVDRLKKREQSEATASLDEVLDKLALRMSLSTYQPIPSLRILEVSQLVVRNYRDFLKYGSKVDSRSEKRLRDQIMKHLIALADSFGEIGKNTA